MANHYEQSHYTKVYDEQRASGKSHEEAQKAAADAVDAMRKATA